MLINSLKALKYASEESLKSHAHSNHSKNPHTQNNHLQPYNPLKSCSSLTTLQVHDGSQSYESHNNHDHLEARMKQSLV
jgi:hypothetical protein